MVNQILAAQLLAVADAFTKAANALNMNDEETYISLYGEALEALDNYQDAASVASVD